MVDTGDLKSPGLKSRASSSLVPGKFSIFCLWFNKNMDDYLYQFTFVCYSGSGIESQRAKLRDDIAHGFGAVANELDLNTWIFTFSNSDAGGQGLEQLLSYIDESVCTSPTIILEDLEEPLSPEAIEDNYGDKYFYYEITIEGENMVREICYTK